MSELTAEVRAALEERMVQNEDGTWRLKPEFEIKKDA